MWQENLRRLVKEHAGGNMKKLSLKAKLGPTAVRDALNGKNPGVMTIEKIMDAMGLPLIMVFDDNLTEAATKSVPICGEVATGVWFEVESFEDDRRLVPVVPGRWSKVKQRAWRVRGFSMEEAGIGEGDFAITVDYWETRNALQDGDIVVIERVRDGGLRERSIREVRVMPATVEFWSRSRDIRYQEPVTINRGEERNGQTDILGLVIGIFRSIGRV